MADERIWKKSSTPRLWRHHACFALLAAAIVAITWTLLRNLTVYSLQDQSSSHIILIPFIAACLIFAARDAVFVKAVWSTAYGAMMIAAGLVAYFSFRSLGLAPGSWGFAGATIALIATCMGAFLLCYGASAVRAALFPLLFLLLATPWPAPILNRVIYLLQQGSAAITYDLFRLAGVPVLRKGVLLSVPGITIEVAQECSSIRSSIALFITCLLAAHYSLRKAWRVWFFVALATVFSVVKNGIRIATLTLLSIYVDPRVLSGPLHRDGGIVFFLLALVMLWPVLLFLQKSETAQGRSEMVKPINELAVR